MADAACGRIVTTPVRSCPVRVLVEIDLCPGAIAAFVDHGPLNVGLFADTVGHGIGLKLVVVAAAPGDQ